MSGFAPSPVAEENIAHARALWKMASALLSAAPCWGETSKVGHAHVTAAVALYGLARTISDVAGSPVASIRSAQACSAEGAALESLAELARLRGPQEVAEFAYQLADWFVTGVVRI